MKQDTKYNISELSITALPTKTWLLTPDSNDSSHWNSVATKKGREMSALHCGAVAVPTGRFV